MQSQEGRGAKVVMQIDSIIFVGVVLCGGLLFCVLEGVYSDMIWQCCHTLFFFFPKGHCHPYTIMLIPLL